MNRFTRIINDPVGQLIIGLSLIAFLLYLNNGNNLYYWGFIVLDVLFFARVVQIAAGKDKPLGVGARKVLGCLDFITFLASIYLLLNMEMGSQNATNIAVVSVGAVILVIMAIASGISYFTKK